MATSNPKADPPGPSCIRRSMQAIGVFDRFVLATDGGISSVEASSSGRFARVLTLSFAYAVEALRQQRL